MAKYDDLTFVFTPRDGKPGWLASNGRWVPDVRGGSGDGDTGDDGGTDDDAGDTGDDAASDDKGDKGGTFDEARARADIAKRNKENASLRARLKESEAAAAKLKEFEDKDKSETQRLTEERDALKTAAATSAAAHMRLEVALDKAPAGMPVAKVKQLAKRLSGSTQEELEADAEELFGEFTSQEDTSQEDKQTTGKPGTRPKEKLRPGAVPGAEPEETDPSKLAALVPRR